MQQELELGASSSFWDWAGAYSVKQCAADTSHFSVRMAAPQKCSLFSRRLTCHGNSPLDASEPPTILPAVCVAGRLPQSARQGESRCLGMLRPAKHPQDQVGKPASAAGTLPARGQGQGCHRDVTH